MPSIRRAAPLVATAALLVPVVAGCAGGSGSGSTSSDGGRLRVAMAFPPVQAMSPYGDDSMLLSRLAVVEGLTKLDKDGRPAPALATSWKQDSPTSWTFQLREADFQDGTGLDARAVVRSLQGAEKASPKPRVLSDTSLEVSARGERTVNITTKKADPLLLQRLAYPALSVLSEKAYTAGGKVDPAGHATGPYTLTELDGAVGATLERNDGYWGEKSRASGVDVRFVADGTARANALRSGQTDIAEYVPTSQASLLSKDEAHEVPSARTLSLYLNTKNGPFADPGLRAAARRAIDSKAIVDSVYEGRGDTARGLLGPGTPWAAEYRQDPRGRAEAAEKDAVSRAEEITLATYTNRAELPETATAVQQQLEKAGFKVRQVVRDYAQIEGDVLAGRFDAFIAARATTLDTGDPASYLASDFTCEGSFNIARLCDKKVDAAVAEASALADPVERRKAEMRAESLVLGTDAVVPLAHPRIIQGVAPGVADVALDPMERTVVTPRTHLR